MERRQLSFVITWKCGLQSLVKYKMLLFIGLVIAFLLLLVLTRVSTLNHRMDTIEDCVAECMTMDGVKEFIMSSLSGGQEVNDESS